MIYLLLSIGFNVLLAVVFRYFTDFGVQNLPAILVNYLVASSIAGVLVGYGPWQAFTGAPPWLYYGLIVGILFVIGFVVVAQTIQHYGLGITAVFQKVSLIVTVIFAVLYFAEHLTWMKLIGIPLALAAIRLINWQGKARKRSAISLWILSLPLLTFLCNGSIDTLLYYLEHTGRVVSGDYHFISFVFMVAAVAAAVVLLYQITRHGRRVTRTDVLGGVVLGVPNFFSIYFLLAALGTHLPGSTVVPINNVGIILLSAVLGLWLFQERFNRLNVIGIAAAIVSILLLTVSS